MRSCILMKSFSVIHVFVSDSSNVIFIRIWKILNFIRTNVQDHHQFSIVRYFHFVVLQLYSYQFQSLSYNVINWGLMIRLQRYGILILLSLDSSLRSSSKFPAKVCLSVWTVCRSRVSGRWDRESGCLSRMSGHSIESWSLPLDCWLSTVDCWLVTVARWLSTLDGWLHRTVKTHLADPSTRVIMSD